jgi:hypothetical protein
LRLQVAYFVLVGLLAYCMALFGYQVAYRGLNALDRGRKVVDVS